MNHQDVATIAKQLIEGGEKTVLRISVGYDTAEDNYIVYIQELMESTIMPGEYFEFQAPIVVQGLQALYQLHEVLEAAIDKCEEHMAGDLPLPTIRQRETEASDTKPVT